MNFLFTCLLLFLSTIASAVNPTHELTSNDFKAPPTRNISIGWEMTETLLSLGITPVGMADKEGYNSWVTIPKLPVGIEDVGARNEPNLELLTNLKPDLILISSHLAPALKKLGNIAPTMIYDVYSDTKTPYKNAQELTLKLGEILGKKQEAKNIINTTQTLLKKNGALIRAANPNMNPLMFVRFIDNSTLHFEGSGSLIQDTVNEMGLHNEWQNKTNFWGFSTVELAKIAEHQQANIVLLQSINKSELDKFLSSPLWQAMAFTRQNKVYQLPPVWNYGGLLAVGRLSNQLINMLAPQQ